MRKKMFKITEDQLRYLILHKLKELKNMDDRLSVPTFMKDRLISEIQELKNKLLKPNKGDIPSKQK